MIIIINGALGVGKSSLAQALHWRHSRSVNLDGDAIGDVNPFEIYDDARIRHLYRTLALLIGFHQQYGYHTFVINYVFESAASLQELVDLLQPLDSQICSFWITCAPEVQAERIHKRNGDNLKWELERFLELQQIQAQAAQQGWIGEQIDTTHMTVEEATEHIWQQVYAS